MNTVFLMDEQKLKELTERADNAKAIAADIAALKKASRFTPNVLKLKAHGGFDAEDLLPHLLLCQLFDLGKAKLIEQKEAELLAILEPVPTFEVQPVLTPGSWIETSGGTIYSSDSRFPLVARFDDTVSRSLASSPTE